MTPARRIYLSPPEVGPEDRRLLMEALDSNWVAPLGPAVDAFEGAVAALAGRRHGAATASGTAALHLALRLVGVVSGAEVLMPTLTFIATATPAIYLGAHPVFLDVDRRTWTLDPDQLDGELARRARAGRLPAAVIAVDLYGQCADYSPISQSCARYDVPLVEDAAEALGATYGGRPAGAFGQTAVFSFNGNKIITTSGGGMLVTDDESMAERARYLASQARQPAVHYEHTEVGYNYRLSNLLAALGNGQLQSLPARIERRRTIHSRYRQVLGAFPGIEFLEEAAYGTSTHWLTCMTVEPALAGATSGELCRHLEAYNIESRPVWKPLHMQPALAGAVSVGGEVSERIFSTGLCLPSGSSLSDDDQERVITALLERLGAGR